MAYKIIITRLGPLFTQCKTCSTIFHLTDIKGETTLRRGRERRGRGRSERKQHENNLNGMLEKEARQKEREKVWRQG